MIWLVRAIDSLQDPALEPKCNPNPAEIRDGESLYLLPLDQDIAPFDVAAKNPAKSRVLNVLPDQVMVSMALGPGLGLATTLWGAIVTR